MAAKKWTAVDFDVSGFDYEGAKLKKNWNRLHVGDQESYPDAKSIAAAMEKSAALKKIAKGDAKAVAETLENAWRAFHAGNFQEAFKLGESLGAFGAVVAAKASGMYASYVCEDEAVALKLFQDGAALCEAAQAGLPNDANVHYFHAFALGRYSQGISITKALAQGLGGKIKTSLKKTLELEPKHAEAHLAFAMYHAEIISKIGGLVGKVTYGASADDAIKHFETAKSLAPNNPVVYLEYGKGLRLLGKKHEAQAVEMFKAAAKCKPVDAMETLDKTAAADELE
jgi:hypothetical protein